MAYESMAGESMEAQLQEACGAGDREAAIDILLKKGADINKAIKGVTPLTRSYVSAHDSTFRFLLAKGADVNQVNARGFTILHTASQFDNELIVNVLLSYGADAELNPSGSRKPSEVARNPRIKKALTVYARGDGEFEFLLALEYGDGTCMFLIFLQTSFSYRSRPMSTFVSSPF